LGRGEVGVAREHLHRERRSAGAEEARHEEVAEVVEAPAFEPGALARALEGQGRALLRSLMRVSSRATTSKI
jgi:hypothetical protein